jgi:predicted dehydrogenase
MSTPNHPISVGILGLGRSGFGIHAKAVAAFQENPATAHLYKVAAVFDTDTARAADTAQQLGCRAAPSQQHLLDDPAIDMIVVATPNRFHFPHALAALQAGKHVLCEKPFTTSAAEVDQLIAASQKSGRVLQPFQQRRYEPDFLQLRAVIASGVLGEIVFVRTCWHSFKRRWDWQTLSQLSAGELLNNGPHPIDHALWLLDGHDGADPSLPLPQIHAERRRTLCTGDAEDHVKIILSSPGRPTIDIEISSAFAFAQDRWLVCGTHGGLKGNADSLEWKYVDFATLPPRPLPPSREFEQSTPDRSYNGETLPWKTQNWKIASSGDGGAGAPPAIQPVLDLYTDLHATIRLGRPQVITPQSVRRRVAVIEHIARIAPVIR